MFLIYKQDSQIFTDTSEEQSIWELFGFLKCFINNLEKQLLEDIRVPEDEN